MVSRAIGHLRRARNGRAAAEPLTLLSPLAPMPPREGVQRQVRPSARLGCARMRLCHGVCMHAKLPLHVMRPCIAGLAVLPCCNAQPRRLQRAGVCTRACVQKRHVQLGAGLALPVASQPVVR